jgi:hypothetical protein
MHQEVHIGVGNGILLTRKYPTIEWQINSNHIKLLHLKLEQNGLLLLQLSFYWGGNSCILSGIMGPIWGPKSPTLIREITRKMTSKPSAIALGMGALSIGKLHSIGLQLVYDWGLD